MKNSKRNSELIGESDQLFCDLLKIELQASYELQTTLTAIQNAIVKGHLESLRELIICKQTLVDRLAETQGKRQSCLDKMVLKKKLPTATTITELSSTLEPALRIQADETLQQIRQVCRRIQIVNRENQNLLKVAIGLNREFFKMAFPGLGETEVYSSDGHIRDEVRPLNLMDRQI